MSAMSFMESPLGQAMLKNFIAHAEHTALASGGRVEHWKGAVLCDMGSHHPYRKVVIPTRSLAAHEVDQLADRIFAFFSGSKTWSIDSYFEFSNNRADLFNDGSEAVMVAKAGRVEVPEVDGLVIREASDNEVTFDWEQTWATAQGKHTLLQPGVRRYDARILVNGQRLWTGYVAGKPVAVSGSWVNNELNLIHGIATMPEYRHQGIGTAMLGTAMAASSHRRYLNCNPGAESIYERLGFEAVATFDYWMDAKHSPTVVN